tara:strand:- start:3251 stop:3793 length:543 start_codon:yes stop_codon:yes gene_type:complete
MNPEIEIIFHDILKTDIYEELLTHSSDYTDDKEDFKKKVKEILDKKYNFKITEPSRVRNLKEIYTHKYNKTPKGYKANDIDWLESKIGDFKLDEKSKIEIKPYKSRYVSRTHFINKKNKCMARLWNDRYSCQCSRKKTKGDYCTVHNNIILKRGLLQFGRIDEPRPRRDYFNNNILNWKN